MTVDAPTKVTVKQAIKQAGQNTTAGTGSADKCKDCVKEHLAIFPALQAIGPSKMAAKLPKPDKLLKGAKSQAVSDKAGYFIRALRTGYLYVFKEGAPAAEQWDAYAVDSHGMLHLSPVANLPAEPAAISPPDEVNCGRPEHNSYSPQFISIDPNRYKKIWLAFSDSRWSTRVFDDYAADKEGCRKARMQPLDLNAVKGGGEPDWAINASAEALEANVAGFAAGGFTPADNDLLYFGLRSKEGQAAQVAKRMAAASKNTKSPGVVFALTDTAGILAETNWQRQRAVAQKALYQADPTTAWKKLSSDAVAVVRGRIKQRKKAELVQNATGKPWTPQNDPKMVRYSRALTYKSEFDTYQKARTIPKGAEFRPQQPGSNVGFIWVPIDGEVEKDARSDLARMEDQYDEKARTAFIDEYKAAIKTLDDAIATCEKDWYTWVTLTPSPGLPDLQTIVRRDHNSADHGCAADYIRVVGAGLGMGPLSEDSLPWFKKVFSLTLDDPNQILLRSLFGNQDSLIKWADQEKKDKIYDSLKGVLEAEDLKANKWLKPVVAVYANSTLAGIGTVAMMLNKNGSLDKNLKDILTKRICATLKLWDNLEIGFIKITQATLGELQQGLLGAAFQTSVKSTELAGGVGQTVRTAARARMPSAVADKTIDALLWTADKVDDLKDLLKHTPGATPEQKAAQWFEAAENNMSKALKQVRRQIPAGKTRDIITKVVKRTDSVIGNPNALMAAGVIYIQWYQAVDNLEKATKIGGPQQLDALLGLGDALCSILGASAQVYEGLKKAKAIATKVAVTEGTKVGVRIAANGLAGIASTFNSIQSLAAAYRRYGEGDKDASGLHFLAGVSFVGAAAASFAMAGGAEAVFFGSLLGLGPAGWAVMLTVAAVGLTYAAVKAEDNEAEKFVSRNQFWSTGKRKKDGAPEPKYASWREEAGAFSALWYGVQVELNWGDTVKGVLGVGRDQVTMKITIAEPDPAEGWRYRLWLTFPDGKEVPVYNDANGNVDALKSPYPDEPPAWRAWDPKQPHFVIGKELALGDQRITSENGQTMIERALELDDRYFNRVRLEFEYFPDAANTDEVSRFDIVETD